MSLRDELLSEPLQKLLVTVRNKQFLVLEIDDAESSRLLADCKKPNGKWKHDDMPDGVLLSRCVRDPDGNEIFSIEEWEQWGKLGRGFTGTLRREILSLNGMDQDDVGREVKNSDTTET